MAVIPNVQVILSEEKEEKKEERKKKNKNLHDCEMRARNRKEV